MKIKKIPDYKSMKEVFDILNQNQIVYAVLRNYDNLLEDEIYMDGHGDVDLICADSDLLAETIKANPQEFHMKKGMSDLVHYYFHLNGNYVSLDLRHIGDGYYCEKWQREMLDRRTMHNGFYVLNEEDHFYTLVYHAIFQKKIFTKEYKERLTKMAKDLNLNVGNAQIQDFVFLLEKYMKANAYRYQYPVDKIIPLKKQYIQDKTLFDFDFKNWSRNFIFQTKVNGIETLVRLKHKMIKPKKVD